MRILAISSDYPPKPGGISMLSWSTILHLQQMGHEVRCIATAEEPEAARAFDKAQPFPTVRVPDRLVLRELGLALAIHRELSAFKPDAVWSAVWFPAAVLVSFLADSDHTVQTVSAYGAEILPYKDGWKQRLKARLGWLRKRVFEKSDCIFALSRYTQDRLLEIGAPPSALSVLPGGVGAQWFELGRATTEPQAPILLTVARLDENKGHDMVIRAMPEILRQVPGARYVIIGPGEENWPRLDALARSLGVSQSVDYQGKVPIHELHEAYRTATLFIMASREIPGQLVEGFGLTFLEAAAVGLPSVGGNSGGIPDAVEDGVSGLLVDPNEPSDIARAVIRLLTEPELAARLGKQGRERASKRFTWSNIAAQMDRSLLAAQEAKAKS